MSDENVIHAEAITDAFRSAHLDPRDYTFLPKPGPPTPWRNYVGVDHIVTVAINEVGRQRALVEIVARRWARANGISVPEILAAADDGSWFLGERVNTRKPGGLSYVMGALDVCDRIAVLPPPELPVPASRWAGDRRSFAIRVGRLTIGGLNVGAFRRARARAGKLEERCTSHGDFYRRNVLFSATNAVSVVDWEFMGPAPRFTDHLRLWSTLEDRGDRLAAWNRITAGLDEQRRDHVATLSTWLVLRLLAENLSAPASQRDVYDLRHARTVVAELPEYLSHLGA